MMFSNLLVFFSSILFLFIVSFVSVFLVSKRNFKKKIVGTDINKLKQNLVAESCGFALIIPFFILILSMFFLTLDYRLLIVLIAVSVFTIIGFFDDNKHKFLAKAIGWKVRALPIAITSLGIALILFFPNDLLGVFLIIILALFFAGVSSFSNTFEGLNGWTVGSSFIITIFLAIISSQINLVISFVYISLASIILGLLFFNKYPARAFPGDSGTLFIGSSIAGIALFSQNIIFIIFVFLMFIPHMIDFFILKMLTNKDDASQQKMRPYKLIEKGKDKGKLTVPDYSGKTKYDFAKLLMKIFGPMREWQVVLIIWFIVLINSVFWTSLFLFLF